MEALDTVLPKLGWVTISERKTGAIKLTKLGPAEEPRNLRKTKNEVGRGWGAVPLIDMLKEAVLRTGFLNAVTSAAGTSSLKPEILAERLMLAIYGYGTNTGIRAVASGGHAHSEDDIRYVRRRYLTPQIATGIANATFTARDVETVGRGDDHRHLRLHARARLRPEHLHRVALPLRRPRHPHLLAHRARVHGRALPAAARLGFRGARDDRGRGPARHHHERRGQPRRLPRPDRNRVRHGQALGL
ncbi:MAG: Tn3 family transposase [Catenulispora sp.]|nr:Tn3 family transposase [Catenulispora sp.]